MYQNPTEPNGVEINSGCTRSFVTARFLHYNLLSAEVTLNPDGLRPVTDHLGRTYLSKYHVPCLQVLATRGHRDMPPVQTHSYHLPEVAILLEYPDPWVSVCLGRDFTDLSYALMDPHEHFTVQGGNGWVPPQPPACSAFVDGGIALQQPQVPGSARTVPCTDLSCQPLPPGHPLLGLPPSAAFMEPLCHAGLGHMPLAISCEALMQILHAFFTHSSTQVLPPPHDNLHVPLYPRALHPYSRMSIYHWPFDYRAGEGIRDASLPVEFLYYDSLHQASTDSVRDHPQISARAPFDTAVHPTGSVSDGRHCPLLYPTEPPANGPWADTGSPPIPPNRQLVIRLLAARLEVHKIHMLQKLHSFRVRAQSYPRNLSLTLPPYTVHPPDGPQYQYAVECAKVAYFRTILHQIHQNQVLNCPSAYDRAFAAYTRAIHHTFYRRVPQFTQVPLFWGQDTPVHLFRHFIHQATADVHQTLTAANHLSVLIASYAHAKWPLLGPVTSRSTARASDSIHANLNYTYALLLEPHSFPMGVFRPFNSNIPHWHGQHIGPHPRDDRGAYLADVRDLSGLLPLPYHYEQLHDPDE